MECVVDVIVLPIKQKSNQLTGQSISFIFKSEVSPKFILLADITHDDQCKPLTWPIDRRRPGRVSVSHWVLDLDTIDDGFPQKVSSHLPLPGQARAYPGRNLTGPWTGGIPFVERLSVLGWIVGPWL